MFSSDDEDSVVDLSASAEEQATCRVPHNQQCRLRPAGQVFVMLAKWWKDREKASRTSLTPFDEPAPPQPPPSRELRKLLFAIFRARHLQPSRLDATTTLAVKHALKMARELHKRTEQLEAAEAQVRDLQQQLQAQQGQSAGSGNLGSNVAAAQAAQAAQAINPDAAPAAASVGGPTAELAAPPASHSAGRKRLRQAEEEEEKKEKSETIVAALASPRVEAASSSDSPQSPSSRAHKQARTEIGDGPSLSVVAQAVDAADATDAADAADASTAAEAAASAPAYPAFAHPAISITLVMQFLQLHEVARAMSTSRHWRVAACDPMVWSDRPTFVLLDGIEEYRRPILVQPITRKSGLEGSFTSFAYLSRPLQQYAQSELLRNVHSLDVGRNESVSSVQLGQIRAALPHLTALREPSSSAGQISLALAPTNLKSWVLDVLGDVLPRQFAGDDPWPDFIRTISHHSRLQRLVLFLGEECQMSPKDLDLLLQSVPQLQSLEIDSFWCTHGLALTAPVHLRSLTLGLTISQVERMCDNATMLANLSTLEVVIGYDDRDQGASDRAAIRFDMRSEDETLTPYRLSCLARLPSLLHLKLQLPVCVVDPMLPLVVAQQEDAAAFQQLQSYTCIGEMSPSGTRKVCIHSELQDLTDTHNVPDLPPLAALRFVHLSCCHSNLLRDDARFGSLCAAMPNVQTLALQLHSLTYADPDEALYGYHPARSRNPLKLSLSWCHSPSLLSLRRLSTLIIDDPNTKNSDIRPRMLSNLHALTQLPDLITFDLLGTLRLNRVDLQELMILRPPTKARVDRSGFPSGSALSDSGSEDSRSSSEDERDRDADTPPASPFPSDDIEVDLQLESDEDEAAEAAEEDDEQ